MCIDLFLVFNGRWKNGLLDFVLLVYTKGKAKLTYTQNIFTKIKHEIKHSNLPTLQKFVMWYMQIYNFTQATTFPNDIQLISQEKKKPTIELIIVLAPQMRG